MISAPFTRGSVASPQLGDEQGALEREQQAFLVEPAAVAAEAALGEYPVARADDGYRIRRAGLAGRPHRARVARVRRELPVRHRGAVRDAHHRLAAGAPEAGRERPVELDVELLELACEVATELVADVGERGVVLDRATAEPCQQIVRDGLRRVAGERETQKAVRPPRERQDPDRRVDGGHRDHACRVRDRTSAGRPDCRPALGCFRALLTLPLLDLALTPLVVLELLL